MQLHTTVISSALSRTVTLDTPHSCPLRAAVNSCVVDDSVDRRWTTSAPTGTTVHKMWTSCVRRKMPRTDYPKALVYRVGRAYKSPCRRTMADQPKATSAAEGGAGKPVRPEGSDDPGGDNVS